MVKKILHIGKYYDPFMGGIEKVNQDIVNSLYEDTRFSVAELCFSHKKDYIEDRQFAYPLYRLPVIGIKFSTPIPKKLFATYRRIRNDYDIIHVHFPNPIASLAILLFSSKAKIILHWHCDIIKQKKLKFLYNPIQRLILNRCDRIITTSRSYAEFSPDLKNFQNKISVIPIGIDNSYLNVSVETVANIKNQYKNKKIIFSLGRLTDYKGYKYLVEAAKELDDDCIVLIGGSGELKDELTNLVKENGLDDKVKFIGRVSDDDLGNYYRAADLFCLPSWNRTEAFGIVLLEAMSLGLPIVACDIEGSGVPWVNLDGITGYNVPVCEPHLLAIAMRKILNNPDLRNQFSKNCIERYKTQFDQSVMVDSVKSLYLNLDKS